MNDSDDAALVAAATAGSPEQFAPIVQRYQDAVFAVALARLRNFHDAQDVAQNVFLEAYQRIGNLNDPKRLGAWLRSIAIHRSIDHLRRSGQITAATDTVREITDIADSRAQERSGDLRDQVMAAIGRLTKTQRETTTLFYINGYSLQQVAAIQEVPLGTVKRRLHDARAKLKQEMLAMVEDVLKSEAPKQDAAQRVYELLSRRGKDGRPAHLRDWLGTQRQLVRLGEAGIDGFRRAQRSQYSPTRVWATNLMSVVAKSGVDVADLAIRGLSDPNRKVRRFAMAVLEIVAEKDPAQRSYFASLVQPLLADRSIRVRRRAAYVLTGWARDVPLEEAATALANEHDRCARQLMIQLLQAVIAAGREQETKT